MVERESLTQTTSLSLSRSLALSSLSSLFLFSLCVFSPARPPLRFRAADVLRHHRRLNGTQRSRSRLALSLSKGPQRQTTVRLPDPSTGSG